jgi:glycerol-3-phosphate acyltransferase PlsY
MGSIIAAACFPLAVWIIVQPDWEVEAAAIVAGAFIVYKHSSNLQRLRAGTEHVFTFGARKH